MPITNGMPSKEEFMSKTDAGFLARRHAVIRSIDDLLGKYPAMSDFSKSITAFKIIEYCDEYLKIVQMENRPSKRIWGVQELRLAANTEFKRLRLLIEANRSRELNQRLQQDPKFRAQQNFNKLIHNPKFKMLGDIQNRGDQPDAKRLENNEILEVLDSLHRVGHGLKKIHDRWQYDYTTNKNFWDYLEDYLRQNPEQAMYSVKYLTENERRAYQVTFRGGQLMQGDQAFSTKGMAVNKNNPNNVWDRAIFVVSTEEEIYSGGSFSNPTRKPNGNADINNSGDILHHSSFLMGKPVLCAGEWIVEGGAIIAISPQSGHYRPPVNIFQNFLHTLKRRGVILSAISVEWTFGGQNHYYNAQEFANANQVAISCQPSHNGVYLRELKDMRNANVYRRPLPPIPSFPQQQNQQPQFNGAPQRPLPPIPQPRVPMPQANMPNRSNRPLPPIPFKPEYN